MFTTWENDSDDPETRAAAGHLSRVVFERHVERVRQAFAQQDAEPARWRKVIGSSDYVLYLTAEELSALIDKAEELFAEYLPRLTDPAARPAGSRAIQLLQVTIPLERPAK
jgi:hypothetical protein